MRVLKITGFVVGGVVALVLALAVAAAVWVQHADLGPVASWAAKKQGYTVAFEGPVSLKLWPKGSLATGKVVVDGVDGKPMFATDETQVAWNWGGGVTPWSGIALTRVSLANPMVNLWKDKAGKANWNMTAEDEAAEAPAKPAASSATNLPLAMLATLQLDVVNLNATYNDMQAGQKIVAKDVNFNVATEGTEATTTLKGTVNDQNVAGKLTVDVADMQNVPLVAKLEAAGLTVALDGRVQEQKSFAGMVNAETANLKTTLAALLGKAPAQAPAADFHLAGDVDVGAQKLSLKNFSTRLGDLLQASGDALVNMGSKPSASGTIHAQGSNLRQLAELVLGAPQATIPASGFDISTKLAGQDAVELQDIQANIGTLLHAAGNVKIVPKGAAPDVDATLSLNAPSVKNLLAAMGQSGTYPARPLSAQATVSGRGNTYTAKGLTVQLDDMVTLKSDMAVTTGAQPEVDGTLDVAGTNLKTTAAAFGVAADALPETAFSVKTKVAGKGTIKADDIAVNLPGLLEATGKAAVTLGSPLNVVANMDISKMNLTALGYCAVDVPTQTAAPTEAAPAASSSAAPWTDDKINLAALQSNAFDITINAKGIDCKRLPMDSAVVKVFNTPSQLDIREVTLNTQGGGNVKLSGELEHAGMPTLTLTASTANLAVEKLVPVLASKGVVLPLNTQAQFNSRGDTTRKLAQNLEGMLTLSATQGKLPYSSLLGSLSSFAKVLQGATTASNGDGTVDSLKAAYTIHQGVAKTDELTVSTGNGAMTLTGTGTADLPNWLLDYTLTPTLAAGNSNVAIPVVLKGPLTAPSIGADPAFMSKLSGRLAGQALKGVLGKAAGKEVGGALGEVLSGQATSGTINNLFKAFGK